MENKYFNRPVDLKNIQLVDEFWKREQELVRTEVIPYQWEALNDRIEDAAPSYCMRNFKVAGKMMKEKKVKGSTYVAPAYTYRGFEALPEDPKNPSEDAFYGFLFQDSDFSKWIEAVGYSLTQHPDEQLEHIADEAIEIVCAAQLENGYLDTYYIINGMDRAFTNLRDHHELYCLGHLVEGAVAYYQATGKDKLLKAAMGYADYVDSYFGPEEGKCKGYPGHEIAEMALVRLYEVTGEEKYLNLSRFFLEMRGSKPYYFDLEEEERAKYEGRPYKKPVLNETEQRFHYHQAHLPVREQAEAFGHSVRGVYLYSGMADVARLTLDEKMKAACERLWDSIVNEKMYITGGIGGTHLGEAFSFPYDLPNDTAYSETCAAIGLIFFARRMLAMTPNSKYADVMELSLYNTVLSGMALDGKSFFYVNPLEVVPEACHRDERKFHVKSVRQKWFGCACCPPNIARLLSSVSSYAYTENEDTLFIHLYMGSTLSKRFGDKVLDVKVEAAMPWEGTVKVSLHSEENVQATLAFRLPGWSVNSKVSYVCGGKGKEVTLVRKDMTIVEIKENNDVTPENQIVVKDGYLYLTGEWQDGDSIDLSFEMNVKMMASGSKVRENIGKVTFVRGPIVYCLEEIDNGKELHLCNVDVGKVNENTIQVVDTNEMGHKMLTLLVPGERSEVSAEESLYSEYQVPKKEEIILRWIPYYAWNNRGEGEMSVWIQLA